MKPIYLLIISLLVGCKKYEEGPSFSLRSRKERVANTWIVDKMIKNGEAFQNGFDENRCTLTKDGVFSDTKTFNGMLVQSDGEWEFSDKDKYVDLSFTTDFFTPGTTTLHIRWEVLKLKEKELWVKEYVDNNALTIFFPDSTEIHFKQQ